MRRVHSVGAGTEEVTYCMQMSPTVRPKAAEKVVRKIRFTGNLPQCCLPLLFFFLLRFNFARSRDTHDRSVEGSRGRAG